MKIQQCPYTVPIHLEVDMVMTKEVEATTGENDIDISKNKILKQHLRSVDEFLRRTADRPRERYLFLAPHN